VPFSLAAQQTQETSTHNDSFVLKSDVNVVLVPVVVRDVQGREVGNLKKEDFQVFDNDKPQVISAFTIQKREMAEANTKPTDPTPSASSAIPKLTTVPERFIVFLFDDMHLTFANLAESQKAIMSMLPTALTDKDLAAVVSISGRTNSGMTRDRAKLQEAIMKLQPQGLYRSAGAECPDIDYYHADLIENKHNGAALEAATQQVFSCAPGLDQRDAAERMAESAAMRALTIGDQDVRVTLGSIREFVGKMISLPGQQRTLILVSPGFLTITREAMSIESQIMDLAARSNVTISALDARGLYTAELNASERSQGSAQTMRLKSEYHRSSMALSENVMAELANATGGIYFHNNNDLAAGFDSLTAAPEYLYLLYISPKNVKQDGTLHHLKVKVDRDGLKLQARRSYFAPKPAKRKK